MSPKAAFETNFSGAWSEPIILSAGEESSGRPCVAVNGELVDFVYESPCNRPNTQICHQRYDPSTGILYDPVQVTNSAGFFNKRPVTASDSYGNLHLIYITNRENPDVFGDEEVYYSIFDASPAAPKGIEYDAENYTLSWEYNLEPDLGHYVLDLNGWDTTLTGNSVNIQRLSFDDFIVSIRAVDLSGQESPPAICQSTITGVREIALIPSSLIVGGNYPNPFNASTSIPIAHANIALPVYLEVFDITGRVVKTIKIINESTRAVVWNGKNDYGRPVCSGVYLYRLRTTKAYGNTEIMTYIK
jgi:hypothetical protein